MTSQLSRLARPFPQRFIHSNPSGGGNYVTHSVVNEKLLAVLGRFNFELVELVRGDVAAIEPKADAKSARGRNGAPALTGAVVGAVCRLSAEVDGALVRVEEVGDCEQPHNWPHDGARLKDAMSDALKRCAMRLGCGLHLWSGNEFTLYDQLSGPGQGPGTGAASAVEHPARESAADVVPVVPARLGGDVQRAETGALERKPPAPVSAPTDRDIIPPAPEVSKVRRSRAKSRCVALDAEGVSVADPREALSLPLVDSCDAVQMAAFEGMLDVLEAELAASKAPFEVSS